MYVRCISLIGGCIGARHQSVCVGLKTIVNVSSCASAHPGVAGQQHQAEESIHQVPGII
jgi:hypothetical protein